jgi:hypothetical protein
MAVKSSVSISTATAVARPTPQQNPSSKKILIWLAILGMVVLCLCWPKSKTKQVEIAVNQARLVCPAAWQQEQDHVNDYRDQHPEYFDIKLTQDACFEAKIHPPRDWHTWDKEFVSDEPDQHFSVWFSGWDPKGPFSSGNMPGFNYAPREWRLKGKGTLRYFRTS